MRISLNDHGSPRFMIPLACVAALLVAAVAMIMMGGCQSDNSPTTDDGPKTSVPPPGSRDARNFPPPSATGVGR